MQRATLDNRHPNRFFVGSGGAPLLKRGEKLELSGDLRVEILRLLNEEDLKRYIAICDMITKGLYELSAEERHWVEEDSNWKVFIRYIIRTSQNKDTLQQQVMQNAKRLETPRH